MATSTLQSLCFLLLFTLTSTAIADDATIMSKLAKALSPTLSEWSGTNFCRWKGVRCASNRVTSINIAPQSLTEVLPSDLNSLSQLTSCSLQGNALFGALPSLANLSMLETVLLGGNNFTFILEGCFQGLQSLRSLSLADSRNLAPRVIPADLAQASNLVKLDLQGINLNGTLLDIFDSLVSLKELFLSYNNLTRSLPKSFAVSGIKKLWLNNQIPEFVVLNEFEFWPNVPKSKFRGLLGSIEIIAFIEIIALHGFIN